MKKAAIGVDNWKVIIFEEILNEAGYVTITGPGVTKDTKLMTVVFEDNELDKLHEVVKKCERKAQELKN